MLQRSPSKGPLNNSSTASSPAGAAATAAAASTRHRLQQQQPHAQHFPPDRAAELDAVRAFAAAEREASLFQRSLLADRIKTLERQKGTLRLLVEWRENESELRELRASILNPAVDAADKELFRAHYRTLEERGRWLQRAVTCAGGSGSGSGDGGGGGGNGELEATMLMRDEAQLGAKLNSVESALSDCEQQLRRVDEQLSHLNETSYETLLFALKKPASIVPKNAATAGAAAATSENTSFAIA